MRLLIHCLLTIAAFSPVARLVAQPNPDPTLTPPPVVAGDGIEPPSEPWHAPPWARDIFNPPPPEELPGLAPADPTAAANIIIEPSASCAPSRWLGPAPWDTGVELGLNGSSGTDEAFSFRMGGYVKRESRYSKLDLTTDYNRTTSSGETTQNNAQLDVRNDWLIDESSPWTLYATTNLFYDENQAFDLQTSANTGVGYRFLHEPGLDFIGRVGGGASREIGGPDDRWVPESLLGMEYDQRITQIHKFYGKLDYYPEWDQIGEYRLVADIGWEISLVQPSNLGLKISASDRFDSTPNGANPHLVNYSVLLLLKL
jgi:hypothetical protein